MKRGNSYLIRVSSGYTTDGKQIIKSFTWKPDEGMTGKQIEKELSRQEVLFEDKVKKGLSIDSSMKFENFTDIWLKEYAEKQLAPKTVVVYKGLLRRINQSIGHIHLDKLQPHHLMDFCKNLSEEGLREDTLYIISIDLLAFLKQEKISKLMFSEMTGLSTETITATCEGKNITESSADAICKALGVKLSDMFIQQNKSGTLSEKTILHHYRLISSILSTAVQWQYIFSNPAERVKAPKVARKEIRYLDEKQAAELIEMLTYEPIQYRTMVTLLIYTGLRRGELFGLKWSDIDFEHNLLSVKRALQYLSGRGVFEKDTKTISSVRTINFDTVVFKLLSEYKEWQLKKQAAVGDQWINDDWLFTQWNGKPIHPETLTTWFEKFIKRNNLPDVCIHSLRHTNATLLIAGGTDIRTVASNLGHAQPTTSLNIYSHAVQSAKAVAAKRIENLLNPTKAKSSE